MTTNLLEKRVVKGKRGLNVIIEVLKHSCTDEVGNISHYAFFVRWRDFEPWQAKNQHYRQDWQQQHSTNILTVQTIKLAFRDQDYGVRADRTLAKMVATHIPHERVSQ